MYRCIYSKDLKGLQQILANPDQAKREINLKKEPLGSTPLHAAIIVGEPDIVEALLKSGADIYIQDKNGSTPLHLAILCSKREKFILKLGNYQKIIDLILKAGSELELKDSLSPLNENSRLLALKDKCSRTALDLDDKKLITIPILPKKSVLNTPACQNKVDGNCQVPSSYTYREILNNFFFKLLPNENNPTHDERQPLISSPKQKKD